MCFVVGLLSFVVAHPYVRAVLPVLVSDFVDVVPFLIVRLGILKDRTSSRLRLWREREIKKADPDDEDEDGVGGDSGNSNINEKIYLPQVPMAVRRLLDDDLLSDQC